MQNKKKILYILNHKSFFVSHRLKIALEAKRKNFDIPLFISVSMTSFYMPASLIFATSS